MHSNSRRAAASLLLYASCGMMHADAAMLRPFNEITGGTVHLTDLFDDLGLTPDRALGAAPAPGDRIVIGAAQLAAIARDFDVAWRPSSGAEQVIVRRRGEALSAASVVKLLRTALENAGAPEGAEIQMPAFEPVMLPIGVTVEREITDISYDSISGRFTALLSIAMPDADKVTVRLSGLAVATVEGAVPTHPLKPGSIVLASDVTGARVRSGMLHGRSPITPDAAIGMSVRHGVAPGQPLTSADLEHQVMVRNGSIVRMSLDSAGIELSAQGTALEQGALGDRIGVRNPTSRVIVQTVVIGPDEVRVEPTGGVVNLAAAQ